MAKKKLKLIPLDLTKMMSMTPQERDIYIEKQKQTIKKK